MCKHRSRSTYLISLLTAAVLAVSPAAAAATEITDPAAAQSTVSEESLDGQSTVNGDSSAAQTASEGQPSRSQPAAAPDGGTVSGDSAEEYTEEYYYEETQDGAGAAADSAGGTVPDTVAGSTGSDGNGTGGAGFFSAGAGETGSTDGSSGTAGKTAAGAVSAGAGSETEETDAAEAVEETEEYNPDETEEPKEKMSGEEVADSIKTIIGAAGELTEADDAGMERLNTLIEETWTGIDELPEEQQEALSASIKSLENACVAIDSYNTAAAQLDLIGVVIPEQTGLANSWRYINGQSIDEALSIVEDEARDLPEEKEEDKEKDTDKEKNTDKENSAADRDSQSVGSSQNMGDSEWTEEEITWTEEELGTDTGSTGSTGSSGSSTPGYAEEEITDGSPISSDSSSQQTDGMAADPVQAGQEPGTGGETGESWTEEDIISTEDPSVIGDGGMPAGETPEVYEETEIWSETENLDAGAEPAAAEPVSVMLADIPTAELAVSTPVTEIPEAELAMSTLVRGENGTATLTAGGETHFGIDVSVWQSTIDWQAVKNSGVEFAIIRCGWGANTTSQDDSQWARNVSECERLGIPYGVYLYSYATTAAMINSEVQHVLRLLSGHKPALPVYIDIEDNSQIRLGEAGTLNSFASSFCQQVSAAGYKAGLYSSLHWYNNYFGGFAANGSYYHWVAQWNTRCTYGGRYEMWQNSSNGRISGISSLVDTDYWYGALPSAAANPSVPAATPTPAPSSGSISGTYYIASAARSNYVVDVWNGSLSSGANVQLYEKNGTPAQQFVFNLKSDGCYEIVNVRSGLALDVSGGSAASGANIQQYSRNNTAAQRWILQQNSDGTYTLINKRSGKALDVSGANYRNGANIQQYYANGTAAQRFILQKASSSTSVASVNTAASSGGESPVGTWYITAASSRSLVLDVNLGSRRSGANIQLYTRNNTVAQRFKVISLGNGYYEIVNVGSGLAVDVFNGATGDRANIQQYSRNKTGAQQWKFRKNADGTWTILNRNSGKALDVANGKLRQGSNIQQYTDNRTAAQKFVLIPV